MKLTLTFIATVFGMAATGHRPQATATHARTAYEYGKQAKVCLV